MVAKDRMGSNPIGGTFFSSIRERYSGWSEEPLYIGSNPIGAFYPEQDVKRFARVLAQWKRVWLIITRTLDRNQETRTFFLAA